MHSSKGLAIVYCGCAAGEELPVDSEVTLLISSTE